jgi:L-seryl-tRNA(Ser) seleniumtransferase
MRKNHLYRALRVCKLTLIAMEETLRVYLSDREDEIPTVEMLGRSATEMKQRAKKVAMELNDLAVRVVDSSARVGGGAAPEIEIPSIALEITPADGKSESMKDRLRLNDPPVIARVKDERIYLDMRTVFPDEDEIIVSALRKILAE